MAVERTPRTCFVTIGATARFDLLIKAALSPPFLQSLNASGYTALVLQHGAEGAQIYNDFTSANGAGSEGRYGLDIFGFDFNKRGLGAEMQAAKGRAGMAEGVVISHAGSGSILDALRIAVPIVVVPNPSLLDNHQVELAEELSSQGYVVHGRLEALPDALRQSDLLREKRKSWPPDNRRHDPSGRGLAGVMDDEMGFVD
ncbi:N-acetylglucosaminyldiphosphodolichol N-acetylglucosaminyltransferase catalytic subunit alg13 [Pseudocyphellaria aurata]|nr:N-acetylglucosaminyldiphosphodolichol N-acetylglucosaminyltransferase catalytic subunit alg13 [Pseudocyphellaria aurata]